MSVTDQIPESAPWYNVSDLWVLGETFSGNKYCTADKKRFLMATNLAGTLSIPVKTNKLVTTGGMMDVNSQPPLPFGASCEE